MFSNFFFGNLSIYEIICEKYCKALQATYESGGSCTLHAGCLSLNAHNQNT
jgi:hypothetical protein